ncbi:MAG TPA: BON domain-containing protein [Burkholderiaceae bacterium]
MPGTAGTPRALRLPGLPRGLPRALPRAIVCAAALLTVLAAARAHEAGKAAAAAERRNWFNDPFAPATRGYPGCPVPEGPLETGEEMRHEAHYRAERGTSCWLAGRCEDSNAYRRDPEINQAAIAAVAADPALRDTSVWLITQRKFVYLQGCVRSPRQRAHLSEVVRQVPRVEQVIDETQVGITRPARYPALAP